MSHPGFVYRERVRFGDLDAMRHVSNVVFLRYFETAWISYRQTLGLLEGDLFAESETGFGLILAEAHIRYRSPVQFDEDLDIALTISDIRRSSFGVAFEMQVGDRLCAEGNCVYVGFDYGKQRSAPLPEPWRAPLEAAGLSE
jgi:acyl-CoA thioester hydrolase